MALARGATGIVYYSHTTNGIGEMTGYDDPSITEDDVDDDAASCINELGDTNKNSLREMSTCVSDLQADWDAAREDERLGQKWYFGLMRFSPSYEEERTKFNPLFNTVKAVNQKLKVIGDELYPVKHRPLTWDSNYDKNGLSADTTLIDQVTGSTARLEFGQFHSDEADYVPYVPI